MANISKGTYGEQCVNGKMYFYYSFPVTITGKRKRVYGKTKEELEYKIKEFLENNQILFSVSLDDTFYEFIQKYLMTHKDVISIDSYYRQKLFAEYYIKNSALGNVKCGAIRSDDVLNFIRNFYYRYNTFFINDTYDSISNYLNILYSSSNKKPIALEKEEVPLPANKLPLRKQELELIAKESLRLAKNGVYYYGTTGLVIYTMICTGCAVTELCSLKWKDFSEDCGSFRVTSEVRRIWRSNKFMYEEKKYEKPRTVYVPNELKELFNAIREEDDYFVFKSQNGYPFDRTNVDFTFGGIVKNVGLLKKYGLQDISYTCGTILLESGVPVQKVASMLGLNLAQALRRYDGWFSRYDDLKSAYEYLTIPQDGINIDIEQIKANSEEATMNRLSQDTMTEMEKAIQQEEP